METPTKDFILASCSPQRYALLKQIGYAPAGVEAADIDETPQRFEQPTEYVRRMAREKALAVAAKHPGKVVLGGDTVIAVGRRIVQKAPTPEVQAEVMELLSGKSHRVLSAVCVVSADGRTSEQCAVTRIVMKKLTQTEIKEYVDSGEWVGCAGYKIEGLLAGFVRKIIGSYSGVVGLPLYEARNMLNGAGVK